MLPQSCLTLCDPLDCSPPGSSVHGIFLGKNTGVGCHFLLQGIFLTHRSNLCLLHCRRIPYRWATREAHIFFFNVINQRKRCLIYPQVTVQWYVTVYNTDACRVWTTFLGWPRPQKPGWNGQAPWPQFPPTRPRCLVLLVGLSRECHLEDPHFRGNLMQKWLCMGHQRFRIHTATEPLSSYLGGLPFLTKTFLFTKTLEILSGISFPRHWYSSGCNLGRGFFVLTYRHVSQAS